MKFKIDGFVLAIIATVIIAYIFPFFGSEKSPIDLNIVSTIGISIIFLFYGIKLNKEKLKAGLLNWKLHVLIQAATFVLFPVLVLIFKPLIPSGNLSQTLWLAFFFLASLPSTVSSSVVMVSLAKGNIPAAIFNASISGIIGILVTPLWMGMFLKNNSTGFDFTQTYIDLLIQIVLPVLIGFYLQKYLAKFASKYANALAKFDKAIILLIIYKSFAHAFEIHLFDEVSVLTLVIIALGVLLLFAILYFVLHILTQRLHFSEEDKITTLFCGSKKSLVHGTVFSNVMFKGSTSLGIILLPIMIYHAIQIVLISFIAQKYSKR